MEIWLDTIDLETITDAAESGVVSGVTTNPAVLAASTNPRYTIEQLLETQPGLVALQVTTSTADEMFEEGDKIARFSDRILVKVPVNKEGLIAIRRLAEEGVAVVGTGVVCPSQAFVAARAGAMMIAPYFSKMGGKAREHLQTMVSLMDSHDLETEILVASVSELDDLIFCGDLGVEAITIKPELYQQLTSDHPESQKYTSTFLSEWQNLHSQSLGQLLH